MMTRKHFERAAQWIAAYARSEQDMTLLIAFYSAQASADNPRFNLTKFVQRIQTVRADRRVFRA